MTAQNDDAIDPAIWEAEPIYADRFYISTTETVRLTFGEAVSDELTHYHSAVVLTRATATELRDYLTKVLADMGGAP